MIIALDFDGCVYSYNSGWQGFAELPDDPVPGASEFIQEALTANHTIIIHTCRFTSICQDRLKCISLEHALQEYFEKRMGIPPNLISKIKFWSSSGKPHAHIYIDDRGFRFKGLFPTMDELKVLKAPWWKKEK